MLPECFSELSYQEYLLCFLVQESNELQGFLDQLVDGSAYVLNFLYSLPVTIRINVKVTLAVSILKIECDENDPDKTNISSTIRLIGLILF